MTSPYEQPPQPEIPPFGVAEMGFRQLSEEVERLVAEEDATYELWSNATQLAEGRDEPDPAIEAVTATSGAAYYLSEARYTALGAELAVVLKDNPSKGRELCEAMARSEHPRDRRFAAFRLEDLVSVDLRLATELFAELLTDPDWDVRSAAGDAFTNSELERQAGISFFRNVALRIARYHIQYPDDPPTGPLTYRGR
jgi:HEAT repeat protein